MGLFLCSTHCLFFFFCIYTHCFWDLLVCFKKLQGFSSNSTGGRCSWTSAGNACILHFPPWNSGKVFSEKVDWQVLIEQGVSVEEIKLYGETDDDEPIDESFIEDGFADLEAVMSKVDSNFLRLSFLLMVRFLWLMQSLWNLNVTSFLLAHGQVSDMLSSYPCNLPWKKILDLVIINFCLSTY